MKKMKNIALAIFLAAAITLPIQSCKKYPDGPSISLLTPTTRLAQSWKIENAKKNESDYTSLMSGYTETYTKGGDYSYVWGSFGGTGKWAFQNSQKEIALTGVNGQSSHTLFILRLEKKSFWYYYMDGSDKYEFHMIPK
jgi:hypothetical protein